MLENHKERKFQESCELQIILKDYDTQKDKRFQGTIRLPHVARPNLKLCMIADAKHAEEAKDINIEVVDLDFLKKFNMDKKAIKKWAKKYTALLASDNIVKQVPKITGPALNKINRFPQMVPHNQPLKKFIDEYRSNVKFQLKKTLSIAVAVGHEKMTADDLLENYFMTINFLISLLKKGWNNIKTLHIKTTMGKPYKLYG